MSKDQENRVTDLEVSSWSTRRAEEFDEVTLKRLREIPAWLLEFYLSVDQCLEKSKVWRDPAPSLEHLDLAGELLRLVGAEHLSNLFDSQNMGEWDKWQLKLVVMILTKLVISYISKETGLSKEQAAEDLRMILKYQGYGFVQPDPQAWGRLSPQARSYLTRLRPSAPRSP